MRIVVIISNLHNAEVTGQQKIGLGLASRIAQEGHHVLVLTNSVRPVEELDTSRGGNLDLYVIPGDARLWSRTMLSYLAPRTFAAVRRFAPDLIHGHGSYASWLAVGLGLLLRRPVIQTIYDTDLLRGVGSWFKQAPLRRSRHVICTSEYLRALVRARDKSSQVTVQPYGVDELWFELEAEGASDRAKGDDVRRVLFWGDAEYGRGIETVMKAVPLVCTRLPSVRFLFALRYRDQRYNEQLNSLVSRYPAEIVSRDPVRQVSSIVQRADVVVLPYNTTTIQPPLTLLESLAAGKPVITTGVEGNAEMVASDQEMAVLVPPGDAEALAGAVYQLATDPDRCAAMGQRARSAMLKRCHWNVVVGNVLELYHRYAPEQG